MYVFMMIRTSGLDSVPVTTPQNTAAQVPDRAPGSEKIGWIPTIKTQRILAFILLLAQGGITVTGSIVRVTGSGLGCDTWPHCHEGSFIPVAGAAPWIHQAIEFGNRLLTFVLAAMALAVFIAIIKAGRRTEIFVYSLISGLGIVLQAVLGGITVHLDLKWWSVALHFLPSMALVWIAAILYQRIAQPDDGVVEKRFTTPVRALTVVSALAMTFTLVTGTMTTGAGPHAGDANEGMEGRLDVDIDLMAHIHGYSMYVYLGATVIMVLLLLRAGASKDDKKLGFWLIAMIIVQGIVGIVQYRLGVPRWTIPFHIAMSSVVVALTGFFYGRGRVLQGGKATLTGSLLGDEKWYAKDARQDTPQTV